MNSTRKDTAGFKSQLIGAVAMVMVSAVTLATATYAWYVANSLVHATSSSISATTGGSVLQIVSGIIPDHGKESSISSVEGHPVSPASSDDMKTWWIPDTWLSDTTKVKTYEQPELDEDKSGKYRIGNKDYYAYVVATYNVYSINQTGNADVYLNASADGGAIQVTYKDTDTGQTVVANQGTSKSLRIGVTMDDGKGEKLALVYAPMDVTGQGNDVNATEGWSTVADSSKTRAVTYSHIADSVYIDQNSKNWAVTKDESTGSFIIPDDAQTLVKNVGYTGVIMRIYVWMEGTDADCNATVVNGDKTLYDVTINLAGIDVATE